MSFVLNRNTCLILFLGPHYFHRFQFLTHPVSPTKTSTIQTTLRSNITLSQTSSTTFSLLSHRVLDIPLIEIGVVQFFLAVYTLSELGIALRSV